MKQCVNNFSESTVKWKVVFKGFRIHPYVLVRHFIIQVGLHCGPNCTTDLSCHYPKTILNQEKEKNVVDKNPYKS
jgi:hypothetical protein